MSNRHRLLLLGTALAVVLWLGMAQVLAQEDVSGEGAIPTPSQSRTESIDTDGFVRTLYFVTAVVAGVAAMYGVFVVSG